MNLGQWIQDDRLLANLIGIHLVLVLLVVLSLALRRLLKNGLDRVAGWTELSWLARISTETARRPTRGPLWSTLTLMLGIARRW